MSRHIFVTPSTPPRRQQPRSQNTHGCASQEPFTPGKSKKQLSTPAKSVKWSQLTPVTGQKASSASSEAESKQQFPITPEITPHPSSRKRKVLSDDIFTYTQEAVESSPTKADHFGLLLPAPSTIGTGRKLNVGHKLMIPKALNFDIGLKTEEWETGKTYREIEEDSEGTDDVNHTHPETPGEKIIDSKKVEIWHGKSFNNYSSDEEDYDSDDLPARSEVVNPFKEPVVTKKATTSSHGALPTNPFKSDKEMVQTGNVNLKTHIEYMNHITGEKYKVPMTSEQMKMKPKKLDFSHLNSSH